MNSKRVVLQPTYVKDFICQGSICTDNCCEGKWNIDVDESHFNKLRNLQDKELKEIFHKYMKRNKEAKSRESYARLEQDDEKQRCILLTEDKLCSLQIKLGAEYLCNVCMVHPRERSLVDGMHELSLTMACPLAAELALLNPEPMQFEYMEEDSEIKIIYTQAEFKTHNKKYQNKLQEYFGDIRAFFIALLQDRSYTLDERMILMGITYKELEKLENNKQIYKIYEILDKMQNLIISRQMKGDLDKIPVNSQMQLRLAKELTDERVFSGIISPRYHECLREALIGIGYIEGDLMENVIAKYEKSYREYLKPYLDEKEFILENYLVNEYFKQLMPFGIYNSIWDSYISICLLYSIIKLHLVGVAGYHKGMTDDLCIMVIQCISKLILHCREFMLDMIKLIKDNNYSSLAYMSILVKN